MEVNVQLSSLACRRTLLAAVTCSVILIGVFAGGCAAVSRVPGGVVQPDGAAQDASSARAWEKRAMLLGAAVHDVMRFSSPSPSEAEVQDAPDGRFVALIVAVDTRTQVLRLNPVEYFVGPAASAAAAADGVSLSPEEPVYVRDSDTSQVDAAMAEDATVVLWYPPDSVVNVGRAGAAAIGVLNRDEFFRTYETSESHRENLAAVGAWVVLEKGNVVSLLENYTP